LRKLNRHAAHAFTGGDAIDSGGNLRGTVLEFALKLAHEESGLFLVALLEDLADADQHRPGYGGYDNSHHQREQEKQLLAKAQGASSSETPANCGAPAAFRRRSRRRPPTA
jgi:hypothetical protein